MDIQLISIILEGIIALIFLLATLKKDKSLFGLVITFGIYVWYDSVRYLGMSVEGNTSQIVFLIATLAALYSAWSIYKKKVI